MLCELIKQYFNDRHSIKDVLTDRYFDYITLELESKPLKYYNIPSEYGGKICFIYTRHSFYHAIPVELIEISDEYAIISLLSTNLMLKLKIIEKSPTTLNLSLLENHCVKPD